MASPAPAGPAQASPSVWKRRLSHPELSSRDNNNNSNNNNGNAAQPASLLPFPYGFPSMSGLRAALLGYIGEAENALRERLGMDLVDLQQERRGSAGRRDSVTSSPSPSSDDETDGDDLWAASAASTSALDQQHPGMRRRHYSQHQHARSPNSPPPASPTEDDFAMLDYLCKLREDISAYVPTGIAELAPSREWLRGLPTRLHAVDLGLGRESAWPDPVSEAHRAMEGARKRVIDFVHTALPPDDWAGWETLGWEGDNTKVGYVQPGGRPRLGKHLKSSSLDERWRTADNGDSSDEDGDDDGGEEPEYLFPNRTPGPAHAVARFRQRRSKSLGALDYNPSFLEQWIRPAVELAASVVDDGGEVPETDEDETVDKALLSAPEESTDDDEERVLPKVPTVTEALIRSCDGTRLITFEDLPFWWRNNQYIRTGYRFIPLGRDGPIPLLKSAFQMHNETVNIHSHFVPTCLIVAGLIPYFVLNTPLRDAHWVDTAMLISYLMAAASCLSSSAGWHILSGCASHQWFEWGACVDYIGISWLIAMSFNTVVYNAYYCSPKTVLAYTSVNLAFGALGSYLPFQKWFNQRKNKHWRILFFVLLNFAMVAPIVQLYHDHGRVRAGAFVSPFSLSVATYIAGLLFYAFHFPECMFPGKFDRWGASHNMWHLAIVGAIILHYRAIFVVFGTRWDYSCAAPDAGTPFPQFVTGLLFGTK